MTTSSRPCFFHSSRMYSASSLLRLEPAAWGSWVKIRCWRRSSSGVGMDLNLDSISVSRAAEAGVKPRMVWAWAELRGDSAIRKKKAVEYLESMVVYALRDNMLTGGIRHGTNYRAVILSAGEAVRDLMRAECFGTANGNSRWRMRRGHFPAVLLPLPAHRKVPRRALRGMTSLWLNLLCFQDFGQQVGLGVVAVLVGIFVATVIVDFVGLVVVGVFDQQLDGRGTVLCGFQSFAKHVGRKPAAVHRDRLHSRADARFGGGHAFDRIADAAITA